MCGNAEFVGDRSGVPIVDALGLGVVVGVYEHGCCPLVRLVFKLVLGTCWVVLESVSEFVRECAAGLRVAHPVLEADDPGVGEPCAFGATCVPGDAYLVHVSEVEEATCRCIQGFLPPI